MIVMPHKIEGLAGIRYLNDLELKILTRPLIIK